MTQVTIIYGHCKFLDLLRNVDNYLENAKITKVKPVKRCVRRQLWQPVFTDQDFINKRKEKLQKEETLKNLRSRLNALCAEAKNAKLRTRCENAEGKLTIACILVITMR